MRVGVGLFIRLRILEFSQVKESGTEVRRPIVDVFRAYPKAVFIVARTRFADNILYYVFATFVLSYTTTQLELPGSVALIGVVIAAALELVSFPLFWLVDTGNTILIWLAIMLTISVSHAAVFGPIAAFFSESFGTGVRYSGTSVGFQLDALVAGALTPFIATALLGWSGGEP